MNTRTIAIAAFVIALLSALGSMGAIVLSIARPEAARMSDGMAGMSRDADQNTRHLGVLPAGWTGRTDRGDLEPGHADVRSMGAGIHVVTGPAVTLWKDANTAAGAYTISATFQTQKIPAREGVGLVWGGQNMDSERVSYGCFLVFGDGGFAIRHRARDRGDPRDVHTLVDESGDMNAVVNAADATGKASNTLEVRVASDSVRFLVNGAQVYAAGARSRMMPVSGTYGIRVDHNINAHIADFGTKQP